MRRGFLSWRWLIGVALVLAAGCGDDNGSKPGDELGPPGNPLTFPLLEGATWTYRVTQIVEGDEDPLDDAVDRIAGTRAFGSEVYSVVISESGARADTSFVRQAGQELYNRIQFDTLSIENEFSLEVMRFLISTLPWKIARFTSRAGEKWTIGEHTTTVEFEGVTYPITLAMVASNEGRVTVTVPAGTFTDVYKARLLTTVTVTLMGIPQRYTQTEDIYIKDGVGIVQQETVFQIPDQIGGTTSQIQRAKLVAYDLEP